MDQLGGNPVGWFELIITMITTIAASSGMWAYLQRRSDKRSASTQLLLGLAHDRIIYLGMNYINRGYLTADEYEDFYKYLCEPYSKFGGNGLAEKVMKEVAKLPIYNKSQAEALLKEKK